MSWANPVNGIVVHDWRCDRCAAGMRQPCRSLRSGKRRRVAHPTRWSTAVVFTLATRWLPRLSMRDRLVLATHAVGVPTGEERPTAWTDVTTLLWQAGGLQSALAHRVVDDADDFIDLAELRPPGLELGAALKEAGNLLRQQHLQGDPRLPEVETMTLPEADGHARRHSLAELRAARDLGQVQVLAADMSRRAAAVAAATGAAAGRWTVRWEASGRFEAEPVPGGEADGPPVRGWAAHPAVVADELGRWSTRPRPAEVTWGSTPPRPGSRLCSLTTATSPHVTEDQAGSAYWARRDRIADVVAEIDSLRRSCPLDRVRDEVAARAARLQAEEPQLPDVTADLFPRDEPWARTVAAEWVRTRAVVSTPDPVWGSFGPDESDGRARWLPESTAELLAVRYADVPDHLARHFAARGGSDAVQLLRIPGPAGPLYAAGSGGSHRAHLCRVLGLPWMFAVTTMASPPRRLETTAVTPSEHGPEGCRATADLWRGLLDRELVRGELVQRYSDWVVELRLGYAVAPWVLLPADRAAAYNQRYELLYPGALAAAGIPDAALRSPMAWRSWLTER